MDRLFVPVVERVLVEIDRKNEELLAARASAVCVVVKCVGCGGWMPIWVRVCRRR